MDAPLLPEIHLVSGTRHAQSVLPLDSERVLRYVWQHRYGEMLIEVKGSQAFVEGKLVEPASLAGVVAGSSVGMPDRRGR